MHNANTIQSTSPKLEQSPMFLRKFRSYSYSKLRNSITIEKNHRTPPKQFRSHIQPLADRDEASRKSSKIGVLCVPPECFIWNEFCLIWFELLRESESFWVPGFLQSFGWNWVWVFDEFASNFESSAKVVPCGKANMISIRPSTNLYNNPQVKHVTARFESILRSIAPFILRAFH